MVSVKKNKSGNVNYVSWTYKIELELPLGTFLSSQNIKHNKVNCLKLYSLKNVNCSSNNIKFSEVNNDRNRYLNYLYEVIIIKTIKQKVKKN
jgi:hypothetical protein